MKLNTKNNISESFPNEDGLVPKGWIPRKMWKLFGQNTEELIEELNKELAA